MGTQKESRGLGKLSLSEIPAVFWNSPQILLLFCADWVKNISLACRQYMRKKSTVGLLISHCQHQNMESFTFPAVLVEVPVVGFPFLSKCYSSLFPFVCLVWLLFQGGAISLQDWDLPLPPQGNWLGKGESSKGHLSHTFLICICYIF